MPQNQAAWIPAAGQPLKVDTAQYNSPGSHDIVIKSHAVAINPVDWKMQDHGMFIEEYPSVFGCDVAGVVEEVGSEVKTFQKGDRVIGNASCLVLGPKYAGFHQYVLCRANVACKIPSIISFQAGSVLPLAVNTAALGLFGRDHLKLPRGWTSPESSDIAIFIYGGSTSVGATAIQLAKAAGVTVVTVAGATNHAYCKALGADHVFDYKDADWVDHVVNVMKDKRVAGAYDSISTESTAKATAEVLTRAGSDALVIGVSPLPESIKSNWVFGANMTLNEDLAKSIWLDFLPQALANGTFAPKPDVLVAGEGLGSIQKGMDMQRKGVSARKVVVTIS